METRRHGGIFQNFGKYSALKRASFTLKVPAVPDITFYQIHILPLVFAQELRKRPEIYFRIPNEHEALSKWDSVSRHLRNVSISTTPSMKLKAIVDAAGELYRIQNSDAAASDYPAKTNQLESNGLGADDFLTIFIFCVVQAEMERPSALCKSCCHVNTCICCPLSVCFRSPAFLLKTTFAQVRSFTHCVIRSIAGEKSGTTSHLLKPRYLISVRWTYLRAGTKHWSALTYVDF